MKSALKRISAQSKPPVTFSQPAPNRAHIFNLGSSRTGREASLRTYGRSGTVYSIVSLLAQSAAAPEWHLYKQQPVDGRRRYSTADKGSDQRVEVVSHAAIRLLKHPNDFFTRFEFFEGSNQHLELTGETFWVIGRELGLPASLWFIRPDRMEPIPSPEDYLVGWIYTGPNGEQVPLKLEEVIQERLPDPLDPFRGAGPVASILPNIEQQRYATEYQRNLFIAGADPGGVITVPNKLTETEFDELVDRWRESHQGVARAGRVGVLEAGATWQTNAHNNKDMEYAELRLANRDEMREAWRIHKSMLGTVEDVNRANAETAEQVFTAWGTIPRLNRRRDTLNHRLLPMFGAAGEGVEFDYEDPSPENRADDNLELKAKANAAQVLVKTGFDPDAVLEVVGLPSMPFVGPVAPGVSSEQSEEPILPGGSVGAAGRERIEVRGGSGRMLNGRDTAAKVIEQLSKDYPPEQMGWVHHATWMGPLNILLSHIDKTGYDKLFGRSQADVDRFARRIRKGKAKPVILVKTPDDPMLHIVDGHGRVAAYMQLGLPVCAYVGVVDSKHGDWDNMRDHQDVAGAEVDTRALAPFLIQPLTRERTQALNGRKL